MEFPRGEVPLRRQLILASGSPRRRMLLASAGYAFEVVEPREGAECGICSRESPPQMVARLALQKGRDVAERTTTSSFILAADTVAECRGQILGKPTDREHARWMLELLRGQVHAVYTGVCLWQVPEQRLVVDVSSTSLVMEAISDEVLEDYLDSERWCGKAGAFGYQDGNDWLRVIHGSESNIVGLPLERLTELLRNFDSLAEHWVPSQPEA